MIRKRLCGMLLALACGLLMATAATADKAPQPMVRFYMSMYINHLGRQCNVTVMTNTPQLVQRADEYELRNHRGEVLATALWHDPNGLMTFRFTVEKWMLGGHHLSVWHDGVKVTSKTGYAAFSDLNVQRVTCLKPKTPAVALTIVCGGKSDDVEEILAVLDKHGVKATFFMNGRFVEASTADAIRIRDAGHELGSHAYYHSHIPAMTDLKEMRSTITKMTECFQTYLGITPRLFRAPFSDTNEKVTALCRAEGQEDVLWNIDSRDWQDMYEGNPKELIRRVTGPEAVSGSVIQFHINGYHTAEVLDAAIPWYRETCGYQVVTVGELLALSGRELPPLPEP